MDDERMLREYLHEVSQLPTLSVMERRALLPAARAGDSDAKKRYVGSLTRATARLAVSNRPAPMTAIEAIQEANVVLVRLVEDPQVADPERALARAVREHLASTD